MGEPVDLLRSTKIVAIVQAPEREDLIARAVAAARGGIRLLALPVSVPFVAEIAAEVADAAHDATVGLSDVVLPDHLNVALAAGADFVVCPIFDPELIQLGRARGLDVIPSVSTVNELQHAHRVHDGPIAIVPAISAEWVGWLCRVFPAAEVVAFGQIGSDNAPQYLEHGAKAVIVDKGLFPEDTDPQAGTIISARANALVELCGDVVIGQRQSAV